MVLYLFWTFTMPVSGPPFLHPVIGENRAWQISLQLLS